MKLTFLAIYENGVFRPLEPIDLANGTRVTVRIELLEPEGRSSISDGPNLPATRPADPKE
jgi:predicted DNA-binding antitoxin AbrB/MazE fold protein